MSVTALHNRIGREASAELIDALRHHAEPLPPPERADEFGAFFDRFGDARVVLLGEATHGTSEFYRARAAITRRLIVHHGFNIVAVEADWPDAARIDDYVRHQARASSEPVKQLTPSLKPTEDPNCLSTAFWCSSSRPKSMTPET